MRRSPGIHRHPLRMVGEGDTEQRWRSLLETSTALNLVALVDGCPVGTASGVPGNVPSSVGLVAMWVARRRAD